MNQLPNSKLWNKQDKCNNRIINPISNKNNEWEVKSLFKVDFKYGSSHKHEYKAC